jgi:NAD-dependent deacetylase
MTTLEWRRYKSIVVLTGAGVSVASGLRAYRGPDGLWNEPETAKFSTAEHFDSDPNAYWKFWGEMRQAAHVASPNAAHLALAQWEKQLTSDLKFSLVTQNVDELHQRGGSSNVAELHGSIFRTRCSNSKCDFPAYRDSEFHIDKAPRCLKCDSALRPDVVLFGEALPAHAEWFAKRALRDCQLFVAIGTSGTVSPASRFVEWAKYAQARTILVNLEKASPRNPAFDEEIIGKAEDILPSLLK